MTELSARGLLLSLLSLSLLCGQEPVDGIAVIVGDNIILRSEVVELLFRSALELRLDPDRDADRLTLIQDQILQSMINQKIMLEMAEAETVEVQDREVEAALDQYFSSLMAQYGSEERVEDLMGTTVSEMRREFWPDMRDQLVFQRFQEQLLADVAVTRNEVINFYSEYKDSLKAVPTLYKVSHILLTVSPGAVSRQAALDSIGAIRERILAGEDFASLARDYSQDPGSARHGGQLGLVDRGTLVPQFEQAAFALKPGETSSIVKTDFGYHLIQLIDKVGEKINVRHVLISPQVSDADEDSAYAMALAIRDSIMSGHRFPALAARYSAHHASREKGGLLGWVEPSTLPFPQLSKVLPSLTIGDVSLPGRGAHGYHLILIHDVKPGGFPTLSSHWSEIENTALAKKKSDYFSTWLERTSSSLYLKNFVE